MKVTETTGYAEFLGVEKYLKDGAEKALQKAAERAFGGFEHITLEQFLQCVDGDFSGVLNRPKKRGFWSRLFRRRAAIQDWTMRPTVLQIYWVKGFSEWAKGFAETLQQLQVPQTADEQRAQDGLPKMTFAESMLVFVRSYFGLTSFEAAGKITMGEILIAKHDSYCAAMYQKKMHAIQIKKAKAKK